MENMNLFGISLSILNISMSLFLLDRNSLYPTKRGHTVLAYVIDGKGYFCNEKKPFSYEMECINYFDMKRDPSLVNGDLVLFDDGDQVMVSTEEDDVRFLLISGKPIGEPIAWYGPIVMNTRDELGIAFEEYNNGISSSNKK